MSSESTLRAIRPCDRPFCLQRIQEGHQMKKKHNLWASLNLWEITKVMKLGIL